MTEDDHHPDDLDDHTHDADDDHHDDSEEHDEDHDDDDDERLIRQKVGRDVNCKGLICNYEGELISNHLNLFPVEIHVFFSM